MNSLVKLFTFSLLLSRSICAAAFRSAPLLSQPTSAALAADTLRSRGYSIFASLLISVSSSTNFSGTLLAPPDYAFSFASTKIIHRHRPPPRPTVSSLLYHTLKPPLILTWPSLSSRDDGDELRTYYNNFCLHFFKTSFSGEVTISSTPFKNPMASVKIHQPDLYVDDHLTVHGIDGVLNPSLGTRCSVTYSDPTAEAVTLQVNRVFIDHAMRVLRRRGYNVVAAAMSIRRADLLSLTSVTVFAVSDEHLFMTPGGYRFDFRHHVIPIRHRFVDLAKLAEGRRVQFSTLAPNKSVTVESNDGAVSVDGLPVGMREVYHSRWMVVVSVISSLDDVSDVPSPSNSSEVPSPAPYSDVLSPSPLSDVHSPAPIHGKPHRVSGIFGRLKSKRVPSPASDSKTNNEFAGAPSPAAEENALSPSSSPSPSPGGEIEETVESPAPSTAEDEVNVIHCDLNVVISNGVEGGDLLCPGRQARRLTGSVNGDDVEEYQPLDAQGSSQSDEAKIVEHVNIADDVFFYT